MKYLFILNSVYLALQWVDTLPGSEVIFSWCLSISKTIQLFGFGFGFVLLFFFICTELAL